LKKIDRITFLEELSVEFKRSKITYKEYIDNENKFIYAKILKEININIRNKLLSNSFLLSEVLQEDVLLLVNHYDIWIEKWNDLYSNNINWGLDDTFVFQNSDIFPKKSELNLLNEFEKIKKD
jgi:hypothetical protein